MAMPRLRRESDWLAAADTGSSQRRVMRLDEWTAALFPEIAATPFSPNDRTPWLAEAERGLPFDADVRRDEPQAGLLREESNALAELRAELGEPLRGPRAETAKLADRLMSDQLNFYSPESLLVIGGGLAMGGLMANTSLDRNIQRHLQSSLHHANTDEWLESLHANKELGDGTRTLPLFAGAWLAGNLLPESRGSEMARTWGENSLRGFLVGAPPLLALQLATGGSRPGESARGSEWQPFHDNNGVSGHSFMGALPFITAAKMTDSAGWKTVFYAASTLAPLSRAADGAHYPSQIALGWWMAFVSASAVHATERPDARWRIYPTRVANGSGMALEYRF